MGVIMGKKEVQDQEISDSEIWADSDEEFRPNVPDDEFYGEKSGVLENSEISALRRVHAKKGYLDGLSTAKEDSLQEGFDKGYPLGASIGIDVGKVISKLQFISTMNEIDPKLKDQAKTYLESAKEELLIQKVLNRRYFDGDLKLPEDVHSLLQRWKSDIDDLQTQIKLQQ